MTRISLRGPRRRAEPVLTWLGGLGVPDTLWTGRAPAPDALVLLPGRRALLTPRAPVIVAPGDRDADAPQVITYGYGARDTLTYASLDASGSVLSLQREIVTLGGARLERQDIPLGPAGAGGGGADGELALALAGALLIA
ncbi:MAG: hypothetical protein FWG93_08605, partial [Oscillospiraceae bacterium]|nr:hypothetical protein [Oscillospiraceae bacterium]